MFASWIRVNQSQVPESVIAEEKRKFDWHTTGWLRSSVGAAACALVAGAVVAIFWSSSLRSLVPFFFLFVISFVALRFGQFAGLAGTICAALLFASILFEPRPSLAMSNPAERNHLICMVVIGICASELLGRRKHPTVYKPW
jgi:K+-sensing histidine kinase KdpD